MSTAVANREPRSVGTWFRRGLLEIYAKRWKICFRHLWRECRAWPSERIVPSLDLAETDNAIELRMDVPDMEAKDIYIRVNGNSVTISGETQRKSERKRARPITGLNAA